MPWNWRLSLLGLAASFQNCGKLWISKEFLKKSVTLALKGDLILQETRVACLPTSFSVVWALGNGESPLGSTNFGSLLRTENV